MSHLYTNADEVSPYLKARKKFYTPEAWDKMINALKSTTTLYVGNLSFYTEEEQVYTLFSMCGPVRRVIMGIHKFTHLPCGFCFVEYYFRRDAMAGKNYLNGTKLDDRIIRADLDPGFEHGRQYGRGQTGGQVRDDRRREFDEGRGGLPPKYKRKLEQQAVASGTMDASAAIQTQTQAYHNHYGTNHRYNERDENKGRSGYGGYHRHDRYYDRGKDGYGSGNKQKNEYGGGSGFAQLDVIGSPGPRSRRDWNNDEGNQERDKHRTSKESKQKSFDSSFAPPPHKRSKLQDT